MKDKKIIWKEYSRYEQEKKGFCSECGEQTNKDYCHGLPIVLYLKPRSAKKNDGK